MADLTVFPMKSPPSTQTAMPDQQDYVAPATASTAGVVQSWFPDSTVVTLDVLVFTSPVVSNPA